MKLILFMVMSIDGIVAIDEETDIRRFSSEEDHIFFLNGAASCDAAVMGRFSYNREIGCRRKYLLSHFLREADIDTDTILLSGEADEIYRRIEEDGNKRVALLGGPRTNAVFLKAGYVDEIYLTVEPVMLGEGVHFAAGDLKSYWHLDETQRLNKKGTVVQHYIRETQEVIERKDRWPAILQNKIFQDILEELEAAESDRKFCRHDITHLLDTARIMQIMNLEDGLFIPKDLVYATGLLHDIGRLREYRDGTPHEQAAEPIAEEILKESGYTEEEREAVRFSISAHRGGSTDGVTKNQKLARLLYKADKAGRLCFQCSAQKECNWPRERKNTVIIY